MSWPGVKHMSRQSKFDRFGGWTALPNYLHDSTALTCVEKVVAWSYYRNARGESEVTNEGAGAQGVAKTHGLDPKTVRSAIDALRRLGVLTPIGERKTGLAQRYAIAIEKPPSLTGAEEGMGKCTLSSRRRAKRRRWGNAPYLGCGNAPVPRREMHPTIKTKRSAIASLENAPRDVTSDTDSSAKLEVEKVPYLPLKRGSRLGSDGDAEPEVEKGTLDFERWLSREPEGGVPAEFEAIG